MIAGISCMVPAMSSLLAFTFSSKNSFHITICVVNRYGLIALNTGIFSVPNTVNKIMMLIVATIGPIEFSAKAERKNPTEATVISETNAKPKAQQYRQNTSSCLIKTMYSLFIKKRSLVPNTNMLTNKARIATQISNNKV